MPPVRQSAEGREYMMERKQITAFLSEQLIQDKLTGNGKYWAREVCLDWGTKDVRRVDFMEFCPTGVLSVSEIEKGIFVSYEVKSCMADYKSGFGQNFVTEKNYLVMPAEVYKKILQERPSGIGVMNLRIQRHLMRKVCSGRCVLLYLACKAHGSGLWWSCCFVCCGLGSERRMEMLEMNVIAIGVAWFSIFTTKNRYLKYFMFFLMGCNFAAVIARLCGRI